MANIDREFNWVIYTRDKIVDYLRGDRIFVLKFFDETSNGKSYDFGLNNNGQKIKLRRFLNNSIANSDGIVYSGVNLKAYRLILDLIDREPVEFVVQNEWKKNVRVKLENILLTEEGKAMATELSKLS